MSYWMVLKRDHNLSYFPLGFRSMSYWMVLKPRDKSKPQNPSFRSMSYWMVLKQIFLLFLQH